MSEPTDHRFKLIAPCCQGQEEHMKRLYDEILEATMDTEAPDRQPCALFGAFVTAMVDLLAYARSEGNRPWMTAQVVRLIDTMEDNFPGLLRGTFVNQALQREVLARMPVDPKRVN